MEQNLNGKLHIGLFGRCNTGKSTLMNILTNQNISTVSQIKGTTTDIVKKNTELFSFGATVLIDTPGTDDMTELSGQRIKQMLKAADMIDAALIVTDNDTFSVYEKNLAERFKEKNIPFFVIYNKQDICPLSKETEKQIQNITNNYITVSALQDNTARILSERIARFLKQNVKTEEKNFLKDFLKKDSAVIMVTPIDSSAPAGRMIMPQVNTLRKVLDNDCICMVCKPSGLKQALQCVKNPALVITDSQAFNQVDETVPKDILLTSFSVILAWEKGNFDKYLQGTPAIDRLKDKDKILLMESCSHQPTCEDIGRVKLPAMIRKYTGKDLEFKTVAGFDLQDINPQEYALAIQCGGCTQAKNQLTNKLTPFINLQIPVTNYGMAIAYTNGIFKRATEIFLR